MNQTPAGDADLDLFAQSLAGELHDGVVQWVVGAKMQAEAIRARLQANQPVAAQTLDALVDSLQQALRESRLLMMELTGPELSAGHWHEALQDDIDRCSTLLRQSKQVTAISHSEAQPSLPIIDWQLEPSTDPLPEPVAHAAYRLAREAIWNALRHAAASSIQIRAHLQDNHLVLEVSDNGQGFDPTAIPKDRQGVRGLARRARQLSGDATITSTRGTGTTHRFLLPLAEKGSGAFSVE